MLKCSICPGRTFRTALALHQHKIASRGHFYCQTCVEDFPDYNALFDHATAVHMRTCESCRRMFTSQVGLQKHFFDSPKHPKCKRCRMGFLDCAQQAAHKAESHVNQRSTSKSKKKNHARRPSVLVNDSSPPLTLQSQSPSPTSPPKSAGLTVQAMSSPTLNGSNGATEGTSRRTNTEDDPFDSPRPSSITAVGTETEVGIYSSPYSTGAKESSRCISRDKTPSPLRTAMPITQIDTIKVEFPDESIQMYGSDQSPRVEAFFSFKDDSRSFRSPLLETNIPLPSDCYSNTSSDDSSELRRSIREYTRPQAASPLPQHWSDVRREDSSRTTPSPPDRSASPLSPYSASKVTETMRAAWHARCAAAMQTMSPRRVTSPPALTFARTSLQFSRLPTISDEMEIDDEDLEVEPLIPLMSERQCDGREFGRPMGTRRRRLSLSPRLSSIPEVALGHEHGTFFPVDPADSDSESSQGIYEHRAEDFLYDSLSENERCQTPMTYLTADDLDFDTDEKSRPFADEDETRSRRNSSNCLTPPASLAEDSPSLVDEICSPCTADNDFEEFADPFNLHPSASNSPMNATFPKRPRAWSVSVPAGDSSFLIPPPRAVSKNVTVDINQEGGQKQGDCLTRQPEVVEDEIDEEAIAADESPPTVIEEDLFSEPDEILELVSDVLGTEAMSDCAEIEFVEEGHPLRSLITMNALPSSPKAERQPNSIATLSSSSPVQHDDQKTSPLHCRICRTDHCRDVTATFCGHIFCNECIVREIMATSKCPVCDSPTLLYCLFKLDLSS